MAARLLGLAGDWSVHPLFYRYSWPDWAMQLGERPGAIALLDHLIAGNDPWEEDGPLAASMGTK